MQPATPATPATYPSLAQRGITKRAAAERLNVSEATIRAWIEAGKLKAWNERDPKSNQVVRMVDLGDVERIERDHSSPEVPVRPDKRVNVQGQTVVIPPQFGPLYVVDKTPPAPRPWLTLTEAAEYSGLTKRWLLWHADLSNYRENATAEQLKAVGASPAHIAVRDMGKHSPGGRWRFHRESLEKI